MGVIYKHNGERVQYNNKDFLDGFTGIVEAVDLTSKKVKQRFEHKNGKLIKHELFEKEKIKEERNYNEEEELHGLQNKFKDGVLTTQEKYINGTRLWLAKFHHPSGTMLKQTYYADVGNIEFQYNEDGSLYEILDKGAFSDFETDEERDWYGCNGPKLVTFYDGKGNVRKERTMNQGFTKSEESYDKKGNLRSITTGENDQIDWHEEFYEDGKIKFQAEYDGKWKKDDFKSLVIKVHHTYSNGMPKLTGEAKLFFPNGKIKVKGQFKNGYIMGYQRFDETETLIDEYQFAYPEHAEFFTAHMTLYNPEGKKDRDGKFKYDTHILKLEDIYQAYPKHQGVFKFYDYKTGKVIAENHYNDEGKLKRVVQYDENGKLLQETNIPDYEY